jgi:hypothetical protein
MFTEALQMVTAQPLLVRRVGNILLKRGGNLCWAEYGETDDRKVEHTVLYFHGAPGCRYEPVMHSCTSYDKRSYSSTKKMLLEYNQSQYLGTQHTGEGVNEGTGELDELDVYSQRGIRLICIERPGFGDSSFVEDRTVADYVDDIVELTHSKELGLMKNSAADEKEKEEKGETSSASKKKANNIYVIGYSAGGPYALAMRSLFEKRQILYNGKQRLAFSSDLDRKESTDVKNDKGVENEVEAEVRNDKITVEEGEQEKEDSNTIKIAAVCVVASSVSAAENSQYRQSFEGMALNLFFSLPMSVQDSFYSVSFGAFLYGVRGSIYVLSLLDNNQTATVKKNDSEQMKLNKDENLKGTLKNEKENENEHEHSRISRITSKLSAIDQIITKSLFKYNGKAMTTDTLATQWGGRPWGFKMTPTPGKKLPPILFFYSKEDYTVPPHTGITLCNECLGEGKEPTWLSGGHSCFILHLNTILDRLLECSDSDEE